MHIIYTTSDIDVEISDSELDEYMEKSLEARRQMKAREADEDSKNP